jgi:aminopeptidase YwaD
MIFRIKFLSFLFVPLSLTTLTPTPASAQKQKKTDKILLANLETHIRYLSDEKLDGRKTGTAGEKGASDYIASEFSKAGLQPKGDNSGWLQAFDLDQGREVGADAFFIVNDHPFVLNKEYFPLAFSAVATVSGSPAIALQESGVPWFLDLRDMLESEGGNGRADLSASIRTRAGAFAKKGATALIVYNSSRTADNLAFDPKDNGEASPIPVIYITLAAKKKYLRDEAASVDIRLRTAFSHRKTTGHNVVGYLDNGAASTVVIGAHYDYRGGVDSTHLRYKGPGNTTPANSKGDSLASSGVRAGDNAGGVAAMIELARMIAASKLKNNNYLFVAFSGGEQGSAGSHFMAEHPPLDPQRLNYMLDLDRIVPPQDSSVGLIIGGYASSPAWWGACREVQDKIDFPFHIDSSYSRTGDQSNFYSRSIPVLVFYAGADNNDHTRQLEILKYVFDIVKAANTRGRLAFTK